jgi:hypothetical protein
MAKKVEGELYESIIGQLFEIGRQLRQKGGYPFNPEELKIYLQDAIEGRFNQTAVVHNFLIWKTIKLGIHKSADEYRKALKANGFKVSDWANDLLAKSAFSASSEEIEVELVKVSVAELGFKNGANRKDIYNRALELGLKLCPNEVGPALRLQYTDQPMEEWLLVAMKPITDSDGCLGVFETVRNSDGLWFRGDGGDPFDFWGGDVRWVFLRGK